jgi:hypothetical protein
MGCIERVAQAVADDYGFSFLRLKTNFRFKFQVRILEGEIVFFGGCNVIKWNKTAQLSTNGTYCFFG